MPEFQIVSPYKMAGDQPEAVAKLVEGIRNGLTEQTLMGVTGSGKTFTMANIIEQTQRPTLVLAHNKNACRAALHRAARVLPAQCGRVFRLLLRLLPARGVYRLDRHLYRKGLGHQR